MIIGINPVLTSKNRNEETKRKYTVKLQKKKKNGPYLGGVINKKKLIFLYDIQYKKFHVYQMPISIQFGSENIIIGLYCFLIGGVKRPKKTYRIALNNFGLDKKANLNIGRFFTSSTKINDKYIYIIGGRHNMKTLSSCEMYSLDNDKWQLLKPLNQARDCPILGTLNARYIYAFEGRGNDRFLRSIEKYDTIDQEEGWEIVLIEHESSFRSPRGGCWCIQINFTELLIMGGTWHFTGDNTNEVWLFNTETRIMKRYDKDLPIPAEIYPPGVIYKGKFYQLTHCCEEPKYNLITYNIASRTFGYKDCMKGIKFGI